MKQTTLKQLAEEGYVLGLQTIGDVARHLEQQEDAFEETEDTLARLVRGHEHEDIEVYLTLEDRRRLDDQMARSAGEPDDDDPAQRPTPRPGEP